MQDLLEGINLILICQPSPETTANCFDVNSNKLVFASQLRQQGYREVSRRLQSERLLAKNIETFGD
jgi:hypothetical protein